MSGPWTPDPLVHQDYATNPTDGIVLMCKRCGAMVGDVDRHDIEHHFQDSSIKSVVENLQSMTRLFEHITAELRGLRAPRP